jgi:ion channel-forming bestrophin family protein
LRFVVSGFVKTNNYRRLLLFILCFSALSFILVWLSYNNYLKLLKFDGVVFSLVGVIISLTLVFRLNSSYNKWWEGRQQWGALVNCCRSYSALLDSLLSPSQQEERKKGGVLISNFCFSMKEHLRYSRRTDEFDPEFMNLPDTDDFHIPHHLSAKMYRQIKELKTKEHITEFEAIDCRKNVDRLLDILGACERIRNTPIPFSHSSFIKVSLLIYLGILPFGLISNFGYVSVIITAVMTFALVGIEIISEEIEEPFNTDPNDLPLDYLCQMIRKDVYTILKLDPFREITNSDLTSGISYTIRS